MFENVGWPEILVVAVLGLFIFGPERLPKVIGDAARMLRTLRRMASDATSDLRDELGTDLDLRDLHPKTFVRKHLLTEEDEDRLRRPLRDALRDFEDLTHVDEVATARRGESADAAAEPHPMDVGADREAGRTGRPARFDPDAT